MNEELERSLSEEEISSQLGHDYMLDDVIGLLSKYKARGESVCVFFNGYRLSLKYNSPEELRKKYLDYAEQLRRAALGGFSYDSYDEDCR